MINQSERIYSTLYKASVFFVVIISCMLFAVLFYLLANHLVKDKVDTLESKLDKLYELSDRIQENISVTSFMLQEIYTDPRYLSNDLKGSVNFLRSWG
ncbi:hypothetical protein [Piscirickettsia litoralis]|uniref:Uncharacterized protein n=1 Tax=Piscirickettsia litoralis TaxID=1891921 RepID=A0ABX3AAI3_9GAMM|nr:hypothetical protein [Piscirickettsia litoralis]ODN43139.1 hypothetical protein BGC07_09720 [Piscirickettsia litoralis]